MDVPTWFYGLLRLLKEPEGSDSWCRSCQKIPEKFLIDLVTGTSNFFVKVQPSENDIGCALCHLGFPSGAAYGEFACINLDQDPEKVGEVVVQRIEFSKIQDGTLITRSRRESRRLKHPLYDTPLPDLRSALIRCSDHSGCNERGKAAMDEITLVNCTTLALEQSGRKKRATVTGAKRKYAALSYVWGTEAPSCTISSGKLVGHIEKTIEDAMLVTKEMGLNYLWVDRYCITQDNPKKHRQISQMDSIYQNAVFTIVAAAGTDPNHGLPGAIASLRGTVPSCRIGNYVAFFGSSERSIFGSDEWTSQAVGRAVVESKWSKRAWTFQEALFSRRCLVFTNTGAFFRCGSPTTSFRRNATWYVAQGHMEDYISSGTFYDIHSLISEYTGRRLTHASDSLNGFLGTLRAYQRRVPPIHHLWGLPITPTRCTAESFLSVMSWHLDRPGPRRPGFPSWSWAGWGGKARFPFEDGAATAGYDTQTCAEITVELKGHEMVSWLAFEERNFLSDEGTDIVSPVIHLKAWTMHVKIFDPEDMWISAHAVGVVNQGGSSGQEQGKNLFAQYEDTRGRVYLSPLQIDDEAKENLMGHNFLAIILGKPHWSDARTVFSIVVSDTEAGIEERFGIFQLGANAWPGPIGLPCSSFPKTGFDFNAEWRSIRLG